MLGAVVGLDGHFRAEGFDLEHAGLGVELGVAAVVRVVRAGEEREALDEELGAEGVCRPAGLHERTEFLLGRICVVLTHADETLAPDEPRIGHVRELPQDNRTAGRERLAFAGAVRHEGFLRDDDRAAGRHHGERPRGELGRPGAAVIDAVRELHEGALGGELDHDLLLEAGPGLGLAGQLEVGAVPFVLDRLDVGVVRAGPDFGGVPQAVSAVALPGVLRDVRHLVVEVLEEVRAALALER